MQRRVDNLVVTLLVAEHVQVPLVSFPCHWTVDCCTVGIGSWLHEEDSIQLLAELFGMLLASRGRR